ncbi:sugar ABC transporter ATP-binding protein [Paenibacillus alvei]|uniref:Autoinducer 2 import ATP-binding protein LsrA n=1 Tax=Paenibacillus alvei TaxID=44250 RepID=A0ABT4GSU4_PAEAL|nr:sugar ABC transporter ATP-binding protein [Paenibacillus alvei]MCY9544011.1 sugar ABC transporter ATP-binding protein [Paenibacillus alvei]MCY9703623.1 sugar ABC transporter ATP-binding protein [Paenibacillus alvei]MCY9732504.1 sugar ABC transporter ATP-binding protein [Paenibacillus alvei]MCY9754438.1 sugar ABC transporter ATP-binding protein [Paenibacillus alvei]MCY9759750.1 sugar ABC transporter ATP-binding protein [Paenibacillus alvei]
MSSVWKAPVDSSIRSAHVSDTGAAGQCQFELDSNLYMLGITKSYNGVSVLKQVNFTAASGEIHALVGSNGAGKSTLMNILSGACQSDVGVIQLGSEQLSIQSPADAKRHGIHCVYQEVDVALVPNLTVAENIMMDDLSMGNRSCWVRPANLKKRAAAIMDDLGFMISPSQRVEECTLAEKQMVLISRIFMNQAKIVIFDEPTASLSIEESERLFAVMRSLRDQGVIVLFITHRLAEVFQQCDKITILRDGELVLSSPISEICPKEAIQCMLDRTLDEEFPMNSSVGSEVLLTVQGITCGKKLKNVSFELRRGEILVFVGLVGSGKTKLARILGGAEPCDTGEMTLNGHILRPHSVRDAIHAGIVLVPEERRKYSLFMDESVQSNLCISSLPNYCTAGFVSTSRERILAERVMKQLDIKAASTKQKVKYLSGGNQQKIAIGKWLDTDAHVFVLDEPTNGIDVGAKNEIFRIIGQLSDEGRGIIYFTSDMYEALMVGDRIVVMYDGEMVKLFNRGEATEEQLLFYASAGKRLRDDGDRTVCGTR